MLVDATMLMLSIGAGFFIVNLINPSCIVFRSYVRYAVYLPEILIFFYAESLYQGIILASQDEVKRFSLCSFFSFIGIAISISIKNDPDQISIAIALLVAWPFATFFLPVGREIARHVFGHFRWWGVPAVIYSHIGNGHAVVDRLTKKHHFGYIPAIIISDKTVFAKEYDGVPVFAPSKETFDTIKKLGIKVAILCDYTVQTEEILTYYRYVIRVPKNQNTTNMSLQMRDFGGILGFSSTNYLTKHGSVLQKRFVDILLCLIALPIVLVLTVIISILIKIESP
ncbi:MAG: undecaprenyl-phosphate galactose phosphotransferase WbaP, partial [Treponema sp.]|nr:undecaprenyl-phosphate galactose phosphotransferase WbaP [Treponema sp.]